MQTAQPTAEDAENLKEEPNQCQTEGNALPPVANSSHPVVIVKKLKNIIHTPQWNLMILIATIYQVLVC